MLVSGRVDMVQTTTTSTISRDDVKDLMSHKFSKDQTLNYTHQSFTYTTQNYPRLAKGMSRSSGPCSSFMSVFRSVAPEKEAC